MGVVLSEEGRLVRVVDDLQRGCEVCGGGHVVDQVPAAIAVGLVQPPSVEAVASLSEGSRGPLRAVVGVPGCPALDYLAILICIRGFYRDIQEWAVQDPSWAQWSVPSPVRKSETIGHVKARRKVTAEMHQRVRERLPHLPTLVESAERHKADQATFLAMVKQLPVGATVMHREREYRRIQPQAYDKPYYRDSAPPTKAEDLTTGEIIDVGQSEHEAFWAWAIIEVLRHTGVFSTG